MKQKTTNARTSATGKKKREDPRVFETMSQQQNRYGKGRERSGSDGGSTKGRGSNH